MKVLVSAYACEPDHGSEPGVGWNVARQVSRDHEVYVITRANNRDSIEEELRREPSPRLHFLYFDLPPWARWWKRGMRGINLYYYLWQCGIYWKAKKLHQEIGLDIVHHVTFVKYWMPSFVALLPVPFLWGPVGGGESAPSAFRRAFGLRGRIYEAARDLMRWVGEHDPFVRVTAKRSRIALATTSETASRLDRLGCQTVTVRAAVGLDEQMVRSLAADPAERADGPRFVSIGRLIHWKGFHLSLRAFALADLQKAEYWVIGDGPERTRLEMEARDTGISDRVNFWGSLSREETLRSLLQADVLVHPSLHDSGGYVCLEAMAAGKPVVCLNLGGPAVLVTDETGIRVEAATPDQVVRDLAQAMEGLAKDDGLRRGMGDAGRRLIREKYLWDRRREEYSEIYRALSSRSRKTSLGSPEGNAIRCNLPSG